MISSKFFPRFSPEGLILLDSLAEETKPLRINQCTHLVYFPSMPKCHQNMIVYNAHALPSTQETMISLLLLLTLSPYGKPNHRTSFYLLQYQLLPPTNLPAASGHSHPTRTFSTSTRTSFPWRRIIWQNTTKTPETFIYSQRSSAAMKDLWQNNGTTSGLLWVFVFSISFLSDRNQQQKEQGNIRRGQILGMYIF